MQIAEKYAISVIIPLYNVEQYLSRCLDSVLNQSFKDIQIICVNDGSKDNSLKILNTYAKKDDRILIISQENKGLSGARNTGLDAVKGDYVFFLDADDYLHPQALEVFYNIAQKTNSPIVISNTFARHGKDKISIAEVDVNNIDYSVCSNPLTDLYSHRFVSAIVWNKLYKKEVIKDSRFIEGIYYEDWPFTACLFSQISNFALCKEKLYIYNTVSSSIVRSEFSLKKIKDYVTGIRYVHNYFTSKDKLNDWDIVRKKRVSQSLKMLLSKICKSKKNRKELATCFFEEYNKLSAEKIISFSNLSLKSKIRFICLKFFA
jgi:glycosyltransferase involved in cell wall biosynthesis